MKRNLIILFCLFFMVCLSVVALVQYSAAEIINNAVPLAVQDNTGENIGPVDLLAAQAEIYERKVDGGPQTQRLLKITVKTTPTLPGAIIFEADVDDSTGTGGTMSQLGAPVPPCACKTVAGTDIALTIFHRTQGDSSGSAFCGDCVDGSTNSCQVERKGGEWYVMTTVSGQPVRALGYLRGYSDPTPGVIAGSPVQTSYTFPWSAIIAYGQSHLNDMGAAKKFNFTKALDSANHKWQISVWYDSNYAADEDDITTSTGPGPLDVVFDVNDWAPDGDGNLADMLASDNLTYCEGNFDQDADVDGGDAAAFKVNFGRSGFKNPCPDANQYY